MSVFLIDHFIARQQKIEQSSFLPYQIYSIFHMTNPHPRHLTTLLLLLTLLTLSHSCTICQKCTNCGPDILADKYVDGIDALLQSKVKNLGYPVRIQRVANSTEVTYSMDYSNGLAVVLSLTLSNMQIQLIDYSLNTQSQTISTYSSSSSGSSSGSSSSSSNQNRSSSNQNQNTSSSGYQQIANYQSNQVLDSILKFLSTSSISFNSSMLATAEQANINSLTYYKIILFVSSVGKIQLQSPIYYQFIVTSTDNQSFKVVNASYVQLATPKLVNLTMADIQNDINVQRIAVYVLQQKYESLAPSSKVVLVARDFPYYRLVFDNQQNLYVTVNIVFDFYSGEIQVVSITSNSFSTSQRSSATQQTATTTTTQTSQQTQTSQSVNNSASQTQNIALSPAKQVNDSTSTQPTSNSNTKSSQPTSSQSINTQTTNIQSTQPTPSPQTIPHTPIYPAQAPTIVSASSQDDQSVIIIQNMTYIKASSSLISQNYVSLYLRYLAATNNRYQVSNLIGIYINSHLPNTLLFRYLFSGQYFNEIASASDIQQILTQNLGSTVKPTQSATINQSPPKTQTNTSAPSTNASTSSNIQQNQVNFGGVIYILTTSTFSSQALITQYLAYLAAYYRSYDLKNLVGVYANPRNASSLLFRYRNNNQFINLVSNVGDIQQLLKLNQGKGQAAGKNNTQNTVNSAKLQPITTNQNIQQTTTTQHTSTQINGNNQQASAQQNIVQPTEMVKVDPKCLCYDKGSCIRCAHRFFLRNNRCIQIPKQCLSYDIESGACRSCLPGYQLKSGICQKEETTAYYFNNQCLACFGNQKMVNQRCVYSPSARDSSISVNQAKNVLCASWRGDNCIECMPGTYLSSRGMCELIDPFCSLFDYVLQSCNSCEKGYSLRNGRCFKL